MKRLLLVLLAVGCAACVRADDKPKDKPDEPKKPTRLERLQTIAKDLQKAQEPLRKEFTELKTDEEREAFIARVPVRFAAFAEAAVKLAEEDLKDAAAFEALMFAMMAGNNEKAAELLATTQQAHAKFAPVCSAIAGEGDNNPAVEKMLSLTFAQSKDRRLQGCTGLALAQIMYRKSEKPNAAQSAKLLAQAEATAAAVQKDYGDVKVPGPRGDELSVKDEAAKLLFEIRNLAIGKTAPEVVSEDLDGKTAKLSAQRGKVVVLDIWATWCGPCRQMIPHEREMVEKLKDKPFTLISISADDEKDTLKKFLEKEKMPWTHWWEGRKEHGLLKDWNVQFFPTIYVIDHQGVIRHKGLRGKKLEEAVEKLLKEAEKKS